MAEGLSAGWRQGPATDAFRPLLTKLLEITGCKPPIVQTMEPIPDSFYVMF
jgi:hypothetical protein